MTVTPSTGTLRAGETLPLKASAPGVKWSSNAPAVATVNGAGVVTGQSAGVVTITAKKGSQKASATITVQAAPVPEPPPDPLPSPVPNPQPPPPPPAPGESPDGTEGPTITVGGQVWTLGPNGETLRDGVHVGHGIGSVYLRHNSKVYVLGGDSNWWQWLGSIWENVGVVKPGTSTPPAPPAPPPPAPPTPPAPVPSPTPTGVLGPENFAYLGGFKISQGIWDFFFAGGAMTVRNVNGTPRLFITGNVASSTYQNGVLQGVAEVADPGTYGKTLAEMPQAVAARPDQWGDIYQGKRKTWREGVETQLGGNAGHLVGSLLWVPYPGSANGAIYWQFYDTYNVAGYKDWHLGLTVLNDGPHNMQAYGPWRTASPGVHKLGGHLTAMPDGSLGLGHSLSSGIIQSSFGPMLKGGLAFPTSATPAGLTAPDLVLPDVYVEHFAARDVIRTVDGSLVPGSTLRSMPRAGDYVWHAVSSSSGGAASSEYVNPLVNNGQGSWTDLDYCGSAIWIDTGTKSGWLFPALFATGHVWYGLSSDCGHGIPTIMSHAGTGPNCEGTRINWMSYRPETLEAVKNGQRPSYTPPDHQFNPHTEIFPFVMAKHKKQGQTCFEPVSKKLYMLAQDAEPVGGDFAPLVHVFQAQ